MIKLDHIVVFVSSLPKAIQFFSEKGFNVVQGGSHPMWGTYNALIYFETSYIELIAIEHENIFVKAAKQPFTLHETYAQNDRRNGYTRIACRSEEDGALAKAFLQNGFEAYGPEPFSRQTPTGETVTWNLVHVGKTSARTLPFLINWGKTDDERTSQLIESGLLKEHPNTVKDIKYLYVPHTDLAITQSFYEICEIPANIDGSKLQVNLADKKIVYDENLEQMAIVFTCEETFNEFSFENMDFKSK